MRKGELDEFDRQIMAMIRLYTELEQRGPTLTEIAGPLEMTKAAVHHRLRNMIRSGILGRTGMAHRFAPHTPGVQIINHVEASPRQ